MFTPQETQVIPTTEQLTILAALINTGAPFEAPIVKLFQNDVVPDVNTVLADLDEADFAGYADVNGPTWGTPYIDVDGNALVTAASHEFVASGPTPANTIYGWYMTDDPATKLLAAYRFSTPVGINATGDGLTLVPFLRPPGQ